MDDFRGSLRGAARRAKREHPAMNPFPQTPIAILARPRVSGRLDRLVSAYPLTVVAAPAGAGKTTAIRQLVGRRSERCAWLTIEPLLDDQAALASALCDLVGGTATRAVLSAGISDPGRLAAALADDLELRRVVVVIDDAHLVRSPAARSMLRGLAERIGPGARLLIAARGTAPLALGRLRSAARVAEVGGDELRFSADEARTLAICSASSRRRRPGRATDGSPALLRLALLAGVPEGAGLRVSGAGDPRRARTAVCHALEDSSVLAVFDPDAVAAVTGFDDPGSSWSGDGSRPTAHHHVRAPEPTTSCASFCSHGCCGGAGATACANCTAGRRRPSATTSPRGPPPGGG